MTRLEGTRESALKFSFASFSLIPLAFDRIFCSTQESMKLYKDSERSEEGLYDCAHLLTLPGAKATITTAEATDGKVKGTLGWVWWGNAAIGG